MHRTTAWLNRIIALALTAFALTVLPITAQTGQSNIPTVQAVYNLGLPSGNAVVPRHLALDNQSGQFYLLYEGTPETGPGLSIYNPVTGQFTDRIELNQGYYNALDLEIDPAAGYIYALWETLSTPSQNTLVVIDRSSLDSVQEISDVLAIAVGDEQLYTANLTEIRRYLPGLRFSPDRTSELISNTIGPLAFDPANERLYLARAVEGVWRIDILEAETLEPLADYPIGADNPVFAQVLDILPRKDEVLVIAAAGNANTLYRMTPDGEPVGRPVELGPRYDPAGLALEDDILYFSNGRFATDDPAFVDEPGPALSRLNLADLSSQNELPLPTNVDALVIDPATTQAYGLAPYDNRLYVIDLANETVEMVTTAVTLKDLLVDETSNRLYVSDSGNRVRLLDGDTLDVLAETTLSSNLADFGFSRADFSGELALDRQRERLYVSGLPAVVLNSETLAELDTIDPGGQIEIDPDEDVLYLTDCGVTVLAADTLRRGEVLPESAPRSDNPLPPNPCVVRSELDAANRRLLGTAFNGIPGSNGGSLLYVYDLTVTPTLIYSGTDLNLVTVELGQADQVLVNHIQNSNRRLRLLDLGRSRPRFTEQLLGLSGEAIYDPTTERFYLNDWAQPRLLTLDGLTLDVLSETRLPPGHSYRLADFDSVRGQLYLIGADGELLVVSTTGRPKLESELPPNEARLPDGPVLWLVDTGDSLIAQIQSSSGEYVSEARLFRSNDGGQSWDDLSANLPPLPVRAVAVSPNFDQDQTLFTSLLLPGQTGGLYRSSDGGQSWSAAMTGLRDLWVDSLFMSPTFNQDGLVFVRTTYGGLHQSIDHGQTWSALTELDPNGLFPTATTAQAAAFSGDGTVLVSQDIEQTLLGQPAPGITDANGLFVAAVETDGRLSEWRRVLDAPAAPLALSPDGDLGLAFGKSGLWRSADGGLTWDAAGAGLSGIDDLKPASLHFSADFERDATVYFFFRDEFGLAPGILFRSTDAGQNWQPWQPPAPGENITAMTLAPNGDILLGNDQGQVSRLPISRLKWAAEAEPEALLIDDVAIVPDTAGPTLLAVSSRHGLYGSEDGGQSWVQTDFPARGYGYGLTKYRLTVSPDFAKDQTVFAATGRSLHRSTDGGRSWTQLKLNLGDSELGQPLSFPAQRVALSPNFGQDSTLLVSTSDGVYRSVDSGQTWTQTLGFDIATNNADILLFGPDGQTVYARPGYAQSLFKSNDGGQTWQEQRRAEDFFSVIDGVVNEQGELTAGLEFETRLLQTGPKASGWQEISGPAELVDVAGVVYTSDPALIVGGSGGVFRSSDGGQSWQALGELSPLASATVTGLFGQEPYLVATLADGSIFLSSDGGETWQDISILDRN